jgi:hypothetical protein
LEIQDTRAKTTTYLSCTRTIQFLLKSLWSPVALWTILQVRLANTGTNIGRTTI